MLKNEMRDTPCKNPCLPTSGTSKNEEWPNIMLNRLKLLSVEIG